MKLKTKFQDEDFELGEVVKADVFYSGTNEMKVEARAANGVYRTFYFGSLKELTDMFEDYEELNYHYCLDGEGKIIECHLPHEDYENEREIGNYFETREEAEKAVERLRAWKRLKDKGFRFDGYDSGHNSNRELCGQAYFKAGNFWFDVNQDLDLLFGGEE